MDHGNHGNKNPDKRKIEVREEKKQGTEKMNETVKKVPEPAFDLQPVKLLKLQDEVRNQMGQDEFQENKHNLYKHRLFQRKTYMNNRSFPADN